MNQLSFLYFRIGDIVDGLFGGGGDIVDYIVDTITEAIANVFYKFFYAIVISICEIIRLVYEVYAVFAGINKVTYDGKHMYLIDVFFKNETVSNVYLGMAFIGIALSFAAAMVAVIKKMFDGRDKDQRSMGGILGSLAKSLLLIISMNFIILVVIQMSNTVLQQVNYVFNYADDLGKPKSIDFTDEQYATMGRILNTIGNYSLNQSVETSYNMNSCYNAIRPDLAYLLEDGVFEFYYETRDKDGNLVPTWQSELQTLVNASDVSQELKLDVYNKNVSEALKSIMTELKTNNNFRPLSHYERLSISKDKSQDVSLEQYLFLICTYKAAKNKVYNQNPTMTDALRGPYFYGHKSIYDYDAVYADFSLSLSKFNYLLLVGAGFMLLWNIFMIVMGCVTRIFNMMLLYLVAPLIFAFEPVDDGEKRKQWTLAFTVQSTSVLATVIAMRVSLMFIPIIMSDKLVLFSNVVITGSSIDIGPILNLLGKLFLMIAGFYVSKKASGLLTGIMANSAGMQSIQGDAAASADKGMSMAGAAAGAVMGAPFKALGWLGSKLSDDDSGGGSDGGSGSGGSGGGGGGNLPSNNFSSSSSEPEALPDNSSGNGNGNGNGNDLPSQQDPPPPPPPPANDIPAPGGE